MATPTKNQVTRLTRALCEALDRADYLVRAIADNGYTDGTNATNAPGTNLKKLPVADQRDVAQFVFFEVAALFEELARSLLYLEVRSLHSLTLNAAQRRVRTADRQAGRRDGWASPVMMEQRGTDLTLTKLHANLRNNLGAANFKALEMAHRLRNRIAHGKGNQHYADVMNWAGVPPAKKRQGCSPGALLLHYPRGGVRAFDQFIASYRYYATVAGSLLP
ncbi:MAG: hypothetical protein ACK52I_07995 [Pseudomonadota bacterium]